MPINYTIIEHLSISAGIVFSKLVLTEFNLNLQ